MTEKELDQMIRDVDLLVIDDYGTTVIMAMKTIFINRYENR